MEIFGVGPMELFLIFILALIFIGPGKMPEVAASLGKAIREFQRASAELTDALNAEIAAAQAQKAASQLSENGHSLESQTSESEVVAQAPSEVVSVETPEPASEPVEPVAFTGSEPTVETDVATTSLAQAVEPEPEPAPAPTGETGTLFGLDPLPEALLAPTGSLPALQPPAPSSAGIGPLGETAAPPEMRPLPAALLEPSRPESGAEPATAPVSPGQNGVVRQAAPSEVATSEPPAGSGMGSAGEGEPALAATGSRDANVAGAAVQAED